jgi:hypothetical protein
VSPARTAGDNVIALRSRPDHGIQTSRAFDRLTATLVLAQYRAGTLPEGVLVALMANAGLRP